MFWLLLVYFIIIGLCVGSFLNVVVLRGLSGESIVLPPSHCTKCDHKLAWYDNIPVLSYLFLRGKCRYCSEKISPQYPLVELFTALVFVGIYLKYGMTLNTVFLIFAASACIVMAVTDIKEKVILDGHAYFLAVLGLVYNFFNIASLIGSDKALKTKSISFIVITSNTLYYYNKFIDLKPEMFYNRVLLNICYNNRRLIWLQTKQQKTFLKEFQQDLLALCAQLSSQEMLLQMQLTTLVQA